MAYLRTTEMKDVIKYKDYLGSVNFSSEGKTFYGKIEGVHDLVTFEGASVTELVNAFEEAVDDYLALCKEEGIEPRKSYKGSLNVRLDVELHRKLSEYAYMKKISINKAIQNLLLSGLTKTP